MFMQMLLASLAMTTVFALSACSSGDDDPQPNDPQPTGSQLNPNAEQPVDNGQGGDDTSAIAGLWDGSIDEGETSDVVYWSLSTDGVLIRYDYQQDGVTTASGENCYIVGDPISVSAEDGDTYSFFNVAATAVVNDETLTITFIDPDINDLDNNGDTTEIPTFNWTLLNTPQVEDLNACTEEQPDQTANADDADASDPSDSTDTNSSDNGGDADGMETASSDGGGEDDIPTIPLDNTDGQRPLMTRAQCSAEGGTVIGDIGDGAIHRPEYRCESGEPPIARITYLEGEPIASEGEVCCL